MIKYLLKGQRALIWYVLLVVCVPLLTLLGFGLVYLWQRQLFIPVGVSWLAVTLFGYAVYRFWPERKYLGSSDTTTNQAGPDNNSNKDNDAFSTLPERLEARADWTPIDHKVWPLAVVSVETIITDNPSWNQLPELALELLSTVSSHYRQQTEDHNEAIAPQPKTDPASTEEDAYQFTLPEVLLLLSVTSERYRQLLQEYLPFADKVRVATLLKLYARQDQIKTGADWLNKGRRLARLANPVAAITAELRDHFTQRIFTNLSDKVQIDLKRLLLQELAQVGMDLYSGRLKSSADELAEYQSRAGIDDLHNKAEPIEPLRVVLLGQVSAGKSSLINALTTTLQAETDILPTTNTTTVHVLHLPADSADVSAEQLHAIADVPIATDVHLIDTPGLIDEPSAIEATAKIAWEADLIIWVTRATQPAKAPEAMLYKAITQAWTNEPLRRPPSVLLIVSHIDQLTPRTIWQPPYDLSSDDRKAQNIRHAIDSCQQQIGLDSHTPTIPVALAPQHPPYNMEALVAQLLQLRSEAVLAQLNRRRIERAVLSGGWRVRWQQARNLGTVTGKLLTRSVRGN